MSQTKGKYVFLDASEEDTEQVVVPEKVEWRLEKYFPGHRLLSQFYNFHMHVVKFNDKINLVSKKAIYNNDLLNFYDSIVSSDYILKDTSAEEIYDIGSGNGFPGMIMAMLAPDRKIVLLDRDRRKIEFLKYMATKLSLKNVSVKCVDLNQLEPATMSCAITRGFASISKALLLAKKTFNPQSSFYHLKGPLWSNEVGEMSPQLMSVWMPSLIHEYVLPDKMGERFVVKTVYK